MRARLPLLASLSLLPFLGDGREFWGWARSAGSAPARNG